jgi:hypothetical protein
MDNGRFANDHRHSHGAAAHPPAHMRWSPMLAGLPGRLAVALALIALLWVVVGWSLWR